MPGKSGRTKLKAGDPKPAVYGALIDVNAYVHMVNMAFKLTKLDVLRQEDFYDTKYQNVFI